MTEFGHRLRPRTDEFAESLKARQDLADLGVDDNGIFLLLVEYGFDVEAKLFTERHGIKVFDFTHFTRIAQAFRVYFAADKYLGVEDDDPKTVDDLKWRAGLELCVVIIACLDEVELERECEIARKFVRILDGRS